MEVYGLTGGIGSGKSTVASMLEEYGIPVVSADELSRMVVAPGSPGLTDVVEAFGAEVLDERGELDRKKMGQIVFTTPKRRQQLEAILHPRIRERYEQVLDALEKAGHPVMVYEVPLLFEKKLDQQDEMKAVILVTATADTRIARVKARDSLTTDEVLSRMRAQMPEQEKRERANYIVHNDGDVDDLRREVEYLLSRFLRIPVRADPRSTLDSALDEVVEEIDDLEEIEEIEEAELDTLSPEQVDEDTTAPLDVPPTPAHLLQSQGQPKVQPQTHTPVPASTPRPASAPVLAAAPQSGAAVPTPVSRSASAPAPMAAPVPTAGAGASKDERETPELEVELQPVAPVVPTIAGKPASASETSARSGSAWIPAAPKPAPAPVPAPAPAPPSVAGPPAPQVPAPSEASQPRTQRKRGSTVPQLEAPELTRELGKQLRDDESSEEPNG